MNGPLSGATYGSRLQTGDDPIEPEMTGSQHRNTVTVNFYGGTSLQAQELNEIQEQIQRQTTMLNKLLQQWPLETDAQKQEAFKNPTNPIGSVVHINPNNMTVSPPNASGEVTINIDRGLQLITSSGGYCYFVNGKTLSNSSLVDPAISKYRERYVNSTVSGWENLGNTADSIDDSTGAGRLQYYNT